MRDHRLTLTIAAAVLVLVGISTAVLVFDPRVNSADALRTGGLAAGSVVAMYALWLNDRRRRVEEQRQELEQRRQQLDDERYELERRRQELEDRRTADDRDRAADERFARAVELLGHEADQVRVGALHALAGLARSHPAYTQTVLDVLCSYLRRPFDHPKWTVSNDVAASEIPAATPEQTRERTVRQAAIRLISSLLPSTSDTDPPVYDLDLTYATLELLDLSERVVGRMAAYSARFRHTVKFSHTVFRGPVQWSDGVFLDKLRADGAVFHHGLEAPNLVLTRDTTFEGTEFHGDVDLSHLHCHGFARFHHTLCKADLDLRRARFERDVDLRLRDPLPTVQLLHTTVDRFATIELPDGWQLVPTEADSERSEIRSDHT